VQRTSKKLWLVLLIFTLFSSSSLYCAVLFNSEVGIKNYFFSVDAKDKLDPVMSLGIGYMGIGNFTTSFGVITGSTRKANNLFADVDEVDLPYSTTLHYSNSLDLLLGKMFLAKSYFAHLQAGINVSSIKIEGVIQEIEPLYAYSPKAKICLGKKIAPNIFLNLNYHHTYADRKLSVHSDPPYKFKGSSSQGIFTLGVNFLL